MNLHALRLLWARRRGLSVPVAMLALTFLLLFIIVQGVRNRQLSAGAGFEPKGLFSVESRSRSRVEIASGAAAPNRSLRGRLEAVTGLAGIVAATVVHDAFVSAGPPSERGTVGSAAGPPQVASIVGTTSSFADTFRPTIVGGRWWREEEERALEPPVVVTADLSHAWGGPDAVVGTIVTVNGSRHRVLGVVRPFGPSPGANWHGPAAFVPHHRDDRATIVLRIAEPPSEPDILATLAAVRGQDREHLLHLQSLEELWEIRWRLWMGEAVFLLFALPVLVFVLLSLGGTLGIEIGRRTAEIGLRRALGATARAVRRQVLFEMAAVTLVASAIGALLVCHGWAFGILAFPSSEPAAHPPSIALFLRAATPVGVTTIVLLVLVLGASYFPARRAARLQPVDALRHD